MRLIAATAAALLLAAAPATAQDDPTPVVGGGSFNAAPILEPGRYRDTLLPTEYLYYGFRLEAGQRLHVTANAEMEIADFQTLVSDITANLHSPTRSRVASSTDYDSRGNFRVDPEPPLDITGPEASAEDDTETTGPWTGPGVYYLAFYAIYTGPSDEPPKAEIPFHFEVAVEGQAQATPTATPTPSPSPTATPTATATPEAEEDDGVSPGLAVAFGIGGLLVGVLGGIALARRRR